MKTTHQTQLAAGVAAVILLGGLVACCLSGGSAELPGSIRRGPMSVPRHTPEWGAQGEDPAQIDSGDHAELWDEVPE